MSYASETKRILTPHEAADSVKASTDVIRILENCTLIRLGALVTVIADGIMTIAVTQETKPGGTGGTALDSVIIPDTTAVGKIVYATLNPPVALLAGQELLLTNSSSGTSSAWKLFAVVVPNEEPPANVSSMVESA